MVAYNSVTPYGNFSTYGGFKPLFDCANSYTAHFRA